MRALGECIEHIPGASDVVMRVVSAEFPQVAPGAQVPAPPQAADGDARLVVWLTVSWLVGRALPVMPPDTVGPAVAFLTSQMASASIPALQVAAGAALADALEASLRSSGPRLELSPLLVLRGVAAVLRAPTLRSSAVRVRMLWLSASVLEPDPGGFTVAVGPEAVGEIDNVWSAVRSRPRSHFAPPCIRLAIDCPFRAECGPAALNRRRIDFALHSDRSPRRLEATPTVTRLRFDWSPTLSQPPSRQMMASCWPCLSLQRCSVAARRDWASTSAR